MSELVLMPESVCFRAAQLGMMPTLVVAEDGAMLKVLTHWLSVWLTPSGFVEVYEKKAAWCDWTMVRRYPA